MLTPDQLREMAITLSAEAWPHRADAILAALQRVQADAVEAAAVMLETSGVMLPICPGETRDERCIRFARAFAQKIRAAPKAAQPRP